MCYTGNRKWLEAKFASGEYIRVHHYVYEKPISNDEFLSQLEEAAARRRQISNGMIKCLRQIKEEHRVQAILKFSMEKVIHFLIYQTP